MISRTARVLFILLILTTLVSCYGSWNFWYEGNDVDYRTETLKQLSDSSDTEFADAGISTLSGRYTVLVFSDTHFGNKKKTIDCSSLYNWLDDMKGSENYPKFAICLGDVVDLGHKEEYSKYLAFCDKLKKDYDIKLIFNTCGNHDIYQNNWENWESACYPHTSFYKFKTSKFSWYSLDTASGTIGLKQYNRLIADFKSDSRPKIVFTHYPFVRFSMNTSNMAETTERNKLITDFSKNNVKCVLGAHIHKKSYDDLGYGVYGLPSLGYGDDWGLMHVDENAGTVSLEFIK